MSWLGSDRLHVSITRATLRRSSVRDDRQIHRAAHCRGPSSALVLPDVDGAAPFPCEAVGSPVVVRPRTPQGRAKETHRRLKDEFPVAVCELDHDSPFQLLAATILSAQCTDARVNMVTPQLFARYPTPEALAAASLTDVEEIIRSTGFYSNKARSLVGMAQRLVEAFDSEVPGAMEDLVTVPGVGRKTANVVRSVALGLPGLPVDTHVLRLTRRLGITTETDPVKVEYVLNAMIPPAERGEFSLRLILHGRRTCFARKPNCGACVLATSARRGLR